MSKRVILSMLAILVLGAGLWLSLGEKTSVSDPEPAKVRRSSSTSVRPGSAVVGSEGEGTQIRRSTRHEAGQVEKGLKESKRLIFIRQAIYDQNVKVEERREVLRGLLRARKSMLGRDASSPENLNPEELLEAIIAATGKGDQDFIEARMDYGTDMRLLEEMELMWAAEKENAGK